MKLQRCQISNFGSYQKLEFDFNSEGLSLIYGATGSGKSTIPDIAAWILYGITAKDGNVDDVRSWVCPNEPTTGVITVETQSGNIEVTRVRGSAKQNDLYFIEDGGTLIRGKDLNDTQKLLEKKLGVDSDLYLTGSYFHEFSSTGNFFVAKAKDRRAIFEKIANLQLPTHLAEKAVQAKKELKPIIKDIELELSQLQGELKQLDAQITQCKNSKKAWDTTQAATIKDLRQKCEQFEQVKSDEVAEFQKKKEAWTNEQKRKIDALTKEIQEQVNGIKPYSVYTHRMHAIEDEIAQLKKQTCSQCGAPNKLELVQAKIKQKHLINLEWQDNSHREGLHTAAKHALFALQIEVNPYDRLVQFAGTKQNNFNELLDRETSKSNPFLDALDGSTLRSNGLRVRQFKSNEELALSKHKQQSLDFLYSLCALLRGELLQKAVSDIQTETNRILDRHFDSEIKVQFSINGDDLDVIIQKSGYFCAYKQLSKGQRQLLKLSFSIAVMKAAANNAGIHFDTLFLDEALDGMDSILKVKTFSLLQELQLDHSSVFVVEHSPEFQTLFDKRYHIKMIKDNSIVELEHE